MVTILSDSTLLAKKKTTVRRLYTFTSNFILLNSKITCLQSGKYPRLYENNCT